MNDGVEFDQSIDAQHSGCANCPTTTSCTLCACTAVCYFHPPHPAASVTAAWCHLCVDVGTVLQRWCAEPQTVDGMYDKSVDWNPSSIRQRQFSTSDGSTILTVATVLDDAIALERERERVFGKPSRNKRRLQMVSTAWKISGSRLFPKYPCPIAACTWSQHHGVALIVDNADPCFDEFSYHDVTIDTPGSLQRRAK